MSAQRDYSNRAKRAITRDEIAARQLHALKQHYTGGKLSLSDVKEMFKQMRDYA